MVVYNINIQYYMVPKDNKKYGLLYIIWYIYKQWTKYGIQIILYMDDKYLYLNSRYYLV